MAQRINYEIGQEVTAQFGNRTDTYGYRENVRCVVVDRQQRQFVGMVYLVRPIDQENFLAECTDPVGTLNEGSIAGQLYSTNARSFGPGSRGEAFGFHTEADARRSLGF